MIVVSRWKFNWKSNNECWLTCSAPAQFIASDSPPMFKIISHIHISGVRSEGCALCIYPFLDTNCFAIVSVCLICFILQWAISQSNHSKVNETNRKCWSLCKQWTWQGEKYILGIFQSKKEHVYHTNCKERRKKDWECGVSKPALISRTCTRSLRPQTSMPFLKSGRKCVRNAFAAKYNREWSKGRILGLRNNNVINQKAWTKREKKKNV